jgi:hypothetical protein
MPQSIVEYRGVRIMAIEASNPAGQPPAGNRLMQLLYRPPYVGLLAFVVVFLVQGLGHTVMILMETIFGHEYVYEIAFATGAVGAVLLFIGMKSRNEVSATWLGFWAGTLLWTGWVEFAFVWSANFLGVPDVMDKHMAGQIATKAEYMVMMSSVGLLGSNLVYFMLNKETKCNMFLWLQRKLHLRTGKPNADHERNFAAITALETIYVVWFCYLLLLFIYDDSILGDRHPVTYALFFLNVIWGVYLFQRLMKFWKVTTAIRYGIPTAIIGWNAVEIAGRWNLFTSFWEKPSEYGLEMGLFAGGIAIAAILAARTPAHKKSEMSRQKLANAPGG